MSWEHWPVTTETNMQDPAVWRELINAVDQRARAAGRGGYVDTAVAGTDWYRIDRFQSLFGAIEGFIPEFMNTVDFVDNASDTISVFEAGDFIPNGWALENNGWCVESPDVLNEIYEVVNAMKWTIGPKVTFNTASPAYARTRDLGVPYGDGGPLDTNELDAINNAHDYWLGKTLDGGQTWFLFFVSIFTRQDGSDWYGWFDMDYSQLTTEEDINTFTGVDFEAHLYVKGTRSLPSYDDTDSPDGNYWVPTTFQDPPGTRVGVPGYIGILGCNEGKWHLVDDNAASKAGAQPISTIFEPSYSTAAPPPQQELNFSVDNENAYDIAGRESGAKWIIKWEFEQQD